MGKTVSVIIPNYNQGQYLVESLHGLLRQTRPPEEIIVVDDGSTDDSVKVAERFAMLEPSVKLIKLPQNEGVAAAATAGLAAASGDLVYHSAADDPVLAKFVESSAWLLERYPQAGLCVTDFRGTYANGDWETSRFGISTQPAYISPERFMDFARNQDFMDLPTHTATYYRQRQIECGGIISHLKWHHDWFVALVVACRHGICYVPESLKILRWNSESYSFTGQRDRVAQRGVLNAIFDQLELPSYADVREFFKLPSVLGRFGFKLLDLLFEQDRLWPYFSWELFARALQRESAYLQLEDFASLRALSRAAQIARAREILGQVSGQVETAGDSLANQQNHEDAVLWYMKLCDLRPESAMAHFKLGSCLHRGGWPRQALKCLERAHELDPRSEETKKELGEARLAVRQKESPSVDWSARWTPIWGKRDWAPHRLGQSLWVGPNDTRPRAGVNDKVSAIVWNQGQDRSLEITLACLAQQSRLPAEVIVVGADPGPIHQTWGAHLPCLSFQDGPGKAQEMPWGQRALSLAQGEHLFFLAAGDRVQPDFLAQAWMALAAAPKSGVCYSPRWKLADGGGEARMLSPLDFAEMGDEAVVMERGYLIRREAAQFPPKALANLEWLGGWFLGLYAGLSRGVCLLGEPLLELQPNNLWPGKPSPSAGQRQATVLAALLNTVMAGQLRYLRPLMAYGGFLARVGSDLVKAAMGMAHLWNAETMMVLQYPLLRWSQEKASRWSGRQPATPSDHLADFDRGRTAVREGRIREAEGIFRELTQTRPDFAPAYASLAVLASSRGQHSLAREQLEKACQLDPANSQAWLQLGKAYRSLGQVEQASRAFKNVLASEPGNQEALGCLEKMSTVNAG